MKLFRAYQKTRFFLVVNILGLAVGLAAAIMLILFVINEYSYDRHFANAERIVSLNTVSESQDLSEVDPINLRTAYTELPDRVPGIEAAVQIYSARGGIWELRHGAERFPGVKMLQTDPEFFKVFQMRFVESSAESALGDPASLVLTRPRAEAMFGSAGNAMGKTLTTDDLFGGPDLVYTVTAVVEPLPLNTHFSFDALCLIESLPIIREAGGREFFTFYLIEAGQPLNDVRAAIEKEYTAQIRPWSERLNRASRGQTERLTDIYLKSEASRTLGTRNTMGFIWMLGALALVILVFAITNFINLFTAQGETRMKEIGVRKTYGAQPGDLVRQLFGEVGALVTVAFVIGMVLAVQLTPAFSNLIGKPIDIRQFFNPTFIVCTVALLIVTIVLSASYTSFYLSRQNPLDILGKRLAFSKSRLTTAVVCFQSAVTIVLMTFIIVVNRQGNYLKDIPLGYNPYNVMIVPSNSTLGDNYEKYQAVKQELASLPFVAEVAGSDHNIGQNFSGQAIRMPNSADGTVAINEYRIFPGLGELMRFEMVEGEFWDEQTNVNPIVLNEAAVQMLGLEPPYVGQQVGYYMGPATIVGVVRDFIYTEPSDVIQPLVFSGPFTLRYYYIRLHDGTDGAQAQAAIQAALRRFDPDYVLSPQWSEDIYESKFSNINSQGRIIFVGSVLSIVLAMLGLLAIHLYSAVRRTKEIGVRRINGATQGQIFLLLSADMLRWIVVAGVVAVPVAWWLGARWLSSAVNHASLGPMVFILPVIALMIIALAVTSGVSLRVCSRNPIDSLRSE